MPIQLAPFDTFVSGTSVIVPDGGNQCCINTGDSAMSFPSMVADPSADPARSTRRRYKPPPEVGTIALPELVRRTGRGGLADRQLELLRVPGRATDEVDIFYSGDLTLLEQPCISVVGTRHVSKAGWLRARKLARELVAHGIVIVSGLARGVDTAAHTSALESGGRTVAVIGTPLNKAYPADNSELQETIYQRHLLLSPFKLGEQTFKGNFPKRNRVMAAISDGTVIIEASDTSGTLHQAAECRSLGRWLFIAKSVVEDPRVTWPARFRNYERTVILERTPDILERIQTG